MVVSLPSALAIHTSSPSLGLCAYHPDYGITSKTWDLGRDMSTQLHHRLSAFLQPYNWNELEFIAVAIGPGGFTSTRMGVVLARTLAQQLNLPLFGISSLAAFAWHQAIAPLLPPRASQSGPLQPHSSPFGNEVSAALNSKDLALPAIAVQMPARRNQVFGAIYELGQFSPSPNRLDTDKIVQNNQVIRDHSDSHVAAPKALCDRPQTLRSQNLCLVPQQPDHIMEQTEWQQQVEQLSPAPHRLSVDGNLGHTVDSVLDLAYIDYFRKLESHWSTVYPFYGQSPV
ncbi:MAG: tRNA (adenosine(37)-N6)-threonylcarbamoyltransferase complex dimerization subunit type 1 TsaB [Merismopedia sp. SIO2A8]|nr:tRNA (adenosine(37)-N6)-threonylcarbamoyltransferase complex dimerization subunit type 1 TsaB [Merismopedia sp. SIO2A8]